MDFLQLIHPLVLSESMNFLEDQGFLQLHGFTSFSIMALRDLTIPRTIVLVNLVQLIEFDWEAGTTFSVECLLKSLKTSVSQG